LDNRIGGVVVAGGFINLLPMIESFRDLIVWNRGIELSVLIYEITKSFPKDEIFGLTSQLRRASVSIPSNIAEGYGRGSSGAYVNFLKTSRGSLYELETQLTIAKKLKYIDNELYTKLNRCTRELEKMLNSLINKLTNNA
jgi:four helix bundle protein